MYTIRTTYAPHELKVNMKYICACGHKMVRVNSNYYTMSPFNYHTEEACKANNNYEVFTQERKCPKCGSTVVPILNADQKRRVVEWKRIYDEDCRRIEQEKAVSMNR